MENAKQKYIYAYLDGYFSDKKVYFGMKYYSMLNNAIDVAENKWKQYKKTEIMKSKVAEKILSETSDKTKEKAINYGNNIVKKTTVEWLKMIYEKNNNLSTLDFKIAKEMEKQQIDDVFEWLTTHNYLTDLKETLIENYNNFKNKKNEKSN